MYDYEARNDPLKAMEVNEVVDTVTVLASLDERFKALKEYFNAFGFLANVFKPQISKCRVVTLYNSNAYSLKRV